MYTAIVSTQWRLYSTNCRLQYLSSLPFMLCVLLLYCHVCCVCVFQDFRDCGQVAISAAFMNVCVCHLEGGEITGTIDESIRHSVTKLAHLHLVCTEDARQRVISMGEQPDR